MTKTHMTACRPTLITAFIILILCNAGSGFELVNGKCPSRYYIDAYADVVCKPCPAGYTCDGTEATECPKTKYIDLTFIPIVGSRYVCKPCPAGYTCDGTQARACSARKYVLNNLCIRCPPGKVCDGTRAVECPETKFIDNNVCKACPVGYTCNGDTAMVCFRNKYIDNNVCKTCPDGFICDGTTASKCAATSYIVNVSPTTYLYDPVCKVCPSGYTCDGTHATVCRENNYIADNVCKPCPSGSFTCDGTIVSKCYPTKYIRDNVCAPCPAGSTCNGDTATPCPKINYIENNVCKPCPDGSTCDGTKATRCGADYDATTATPTGPVIRTAVRGYTGSGYMDYQGATDSLEWTVTTCQAGPHVAKFRYALGSKQNRPQRVTVNGAEVKASKSFLDTGSWSVWKTVSVRVQLNAGTNTIKLTATGNSGANFDKMTLFAETPGCFGDFDATAASPAGPVISKADGGYTGSGYMDYQGATDSLEWTVTKCQAGTYVAKFRYALGSTGEKRPQLVKVNGAEVLSTLNFYNTGGWDKWHTVSVRVQLNAGTNSIKLTATGLSGGNFDKMSLDYFSYVGYQLAPTNEPCPSGYQLITSQPDCVAAALELGQSIAQPAPEWVADSFHSCCLLDAWGQRGFWFEVATYPQWRDDNKCKPSPTTRGVCKPINCQDKPPAPRRGYPNGCAGVTSGRQAATWCTNRGPGARGKYAWYEHCCQWHAGGTFDDVISTFKKKFFFQTKSYETRPRCVQKDFNCNDDVPNGGCAAVYDETSEKYSIKFDNCGDSASGDGCLWSYVCKNQFHSQYNPDGRYQWFGACCVMHYVGAKRNPTDQIEQFKYHECFRNPHVCAPDKSAALVNTTQAVENVDRSIEEVGPVTTTVRLYPTKLKDAGSTALPALFVFSVGTIFVWIM